MTQQEAIDFVHNHNDDDNLDSDDVTEAFTALYQRLPDDLDRREGLWSHCCAAVDESIDHNAIARQRMLDWYDELEANGGIPF